MLKDYEILILNDETGTLYKIIETLEDFRIETAIYEVEISLNVDLKFDISNVNPEMINVFSIVLLKIKEAYGKKIIYENDIFKTLDEKWFEGRKLEIVNRSTLMGGRLK